jgi:hypothetical protein
MRPKRRQVLYNDVTGRIHACEDIEGRGRRTIFRQQLVGKNGIVCYMFAYTEFNLLAFVEWR